MDLRIMLRAIWAKALWIAAGVFLAGTLGFVISNILPKTYEAEARLVVEAGLGLSGSSSDDVLNAPRVGQTYAALATTRPVLLEVIARAGLTNDPDQLLDRLLVTAGIETPIISIVMSDGDPIVAAATANAMAAVLVEMATDRSVVGAPPTELLKLIEPATPPTDFSAPRPLFNTLLSATAVLVAMVTLLSTVMYLRDERTATAGARGG
jgi:succinoglycan biosynthesis transport protein ExoP